LRADGGVKSHSTLTPACERLRQPTARQLVQGVIAPLLWRDLEAAYTDVRIPLVVIVTLGVLTMQVRRSASGGC
jgi:hypothetical protein